jgi:cysteinyl-tRNA synthetase
VPEEIIAMADKRLQLKIKKEYEDADSIRKEIRDQ